MVSFVIPKYITRRALKRARAYRFSAADMARDAQPPRMSTCTRCYASIAKGTRCQDKDGEDGKPDGARCQKCCKGNRGHCFEVGGEIVMC